MHEMTINPAGCLPSRLALPIITDEKREINVTNKKLQSLHETHALNGLQIVNLT